jgi:hypothetical protein
MKMGFGEIGWGGINWIDLAQDRALVNKVMNFGFQYMLENS